MNHDQQQPSADDPNRVVADIQRKDFVPLLDDFVSHTSQVADGVTNVIEAGGGGDLVLLADGSHGSLAAAEAPAAAKRKF